MTRMICGVLQLVVTTATTVVTTAAEKLHNLQNLLQSNSLWLISGKGRISRRLCVFYYERAY